MTGDDLLPGIARDGTGPIVVFDSRLAISRARRRAAWRDGLQLTLLGGLDWMFVRWPLTHVPALDRSHSVLLVALLNATLITHLIATRTFPRWSARRIAATWCRSERSRFRESVTRRKR